MSLEYSDVEVYAGSDSMVYLSCICGWEVTAKGWPVTVDTILEEFDGHEQSGCRE